MYHLALIRNYCKSPAQTSSPKTPIHVLTQGNTAKNKSSKTNYF